MKTRRKYLLLLSIKLCIFSCILKTASDKKKNSLLSWQSFPLATRDSAGHKHNILGQVDASGESLHIVFSEKQKLCLSGWYLNCHMLKLSWHWFIHPSFICSFFHSLFFEHLYFLCIGIYCLLLLLLLLFSLRDSWLLTWPVIFYWNLDILGIIL